MAVVVWALLAVLGRGLQVAFVGSLVSGLSGVEAGLTLLPSEHMMGNKSDEQAIVMGRLGLDSTNNVSYVSSDAGRISVFRI